MADYQTDYPAMGTSIADEVSNRSGQPGGSNAPGTQYPTAGHRPMPPHVQAARRRQVLIDGMTGQAVFDGADRDLKWQIRKAQDAATAVNQAIMRSPSNAGRLGGGIVLARPADHLPWIFFGAGD
jgi:hypothetical protein